MPPREKTSAGKEVANPKEVDLLGFYKSRMEDFERGRAELLQAVDRLAVQASEQHSLQWENQKRAGEVCELQKALSDAHAFLFEERQRLLALQADNDELRLQEIEDRKRIQQLLGGGSAADAAQRQHQAKPYAHYSTDALLLKIESLQAQLNEQKQLAAERVAALLEDRRIREAEQEAHRQQQSQALAQARSSVGRLEEQLRQATKDYILAKRDKQAAEEKAITCEAALQQEQQRIAGDIAALKRKYERELKEARGAAEAKHDDVATNLRQQLRAKEEELSGLVSVHTALKNQYEQRMTELEERATKLSAANKQLEQRRHLDMEGFQSDITYLRKLLMAVDRKLHEMRLMDRLEDDERLDALLAALRKKAPVPLPPPGPGSGSHAAAGSSAGMRQQRPDTAPVSDTSSVKTELARGLDEIRGRIRGLDDKLSLRKKAAQQAPVR